MIKRNRRLILTAMLIACSVASLLWGEIGWKFGSNLHLLGMFLFAVTWILSAMALAAIWEPKRWQAWVIIAATSTPALHHPGRTAIVFMALAIQNMD